MSYIYRVVNKDDEVSGFVFDSADTAEHVADYLNQKVVTEQTNTIHADELGNYLGVLYAGWIEWKVGNFFESSVNIVIHKPLREFRPDFKDRKVVEFYAEEGEHDELTVSLQMFIPEVIDRIITDEEFKDKLVKLMKIANDTWISSRDESVVQSKLEEVF